MSLIYTKNCSLSGLLLQKIKTFLLLTIFTVSSFNVFAQTSSLISDCGDFISGPSAWPHVLVATTVADGAASQAAQTFTMNVTSLPAGGANVRVFKTTANGSNFFGNPVALTLGSNSITVSAVTFDRAVKFQFSSGAVEFDDLSLNGVTSSCVGTTVAISGCTDAAANNYDATATIDDGSCTYDILGCTDTTATNYDSTATVDDGSCIFPSVCAVATNLNTTNVVHSRATFNWDNTGAEYYRIRVNTGSGWSILTQIGAADGFAHPNASKTRYFLTPNTTYEWQVRGWCLDGSVSSWSASATFSTLEECPNATNLGATGVEGEWATMTWDAPAATHGVDYYLARVREVGSSSWNIKGNIGNGLSKTIGSLAQGATYEFETRTWCNTGDANNPSDPYYKSDWGGNGQFTTVPCPVQTDNLAVTQLTATSADFSWTLISATPAADHFTIRFREVGATTWNYRSVAGGGTATGRTIGGFTSGVDYEWEVRTFCGVGSTWKSPWFAGPDFNLGSGARVNTPFSQLEVFPNPSRDIFNVSFVSDEIQNVTIKVVNMIGEEVHANELVEFVGQYTNKIDLSTQPKGVYFLEITSDNGGINKKVVLQ